MSSKPFALMFDVNRTILIEDKAAGKTRNDEVVTILASSCYGRVLVEDIVSWVPTTDLKLGQTPEDGNLISYYTFVNDYLFPFPTFSADVPKDEKHRTISEIKDNRRALLKKFVNEDQPGSRWITDYQTLLKLSEQPEGFELLFSFYNTIAYFRNLESQPFSLCFRTFGEDIVKVCFFFLKKYGFLAGGQASELAQPFLAGASSFVLIIDFQQWCGLFDPPLPLLSLPPPPLRPPPPPPPPPPVLVVYRVPHLIFFS
eukprot:TRINITY_DN5594_c0_g3_i2.p1 TRINITY_DN5594_c0_g3~~TRINITY_DN5594_c0_g3_i2.p1  ORF type:complete len:257 (-),score=46.48 TRINITY_DN5594_c0_g3_i2:771-1541(-)